MQYNKSSLSLNYEVSLLRSMIVFVTIIFSVLGGFVDGNPTNNFTIWMYFLGVSPVIFIFTLFINKHTQVSLLVLFLLLIISSFVFNKVLFYDLNGVISFYKIILVIFHFIVMNFFFWKVSKTLLIDDVESNLSFFKMTGSVKNSRRLVRRNNRRRKSRANYNTNIKSGQYRG